MASARFVPPETTLEALIEEQANKNTLSKTKRDVSLLKKFVVLGFRNLARYKCDTTAKINAL